MRLLSFGLFLGRDIETQACDGVRFVKLDPTALSLPYVALRV